MQNSRSLLACFLIIIILLFYRLFYSDLNNRALRVTTWDALGYYLYLPGIFIYSDVTQLNWFEQIDKKYSVSGGWVYQANKYKNGNYVFKYLGGVAILEAPFFFVGHAIAKIGNYPVDGFSPPYQYAIAFGILLYCMLGVFILRKILLMYFSDFGVAVTLLLLMLATNIIQYTAIDNAMSHGPIFLLYVLVIYTTIKWHSQPSKLWASLTGFIIGIAAIARPTEMIMLFIPLLWNTHTKENAVQKWALVKKNRVHIIIALIAGFIAVLPQLIYWKIATGQFVYDVGSKWSFLNPFFRVLIGWEKGWFIYTPVTIFFIAGMFFMKNYTFKKSVLWFCLLNIWIVISWFDWRYGGSYSTRALSQSYPVFALPLAAFVERINMTKWKWLFYSLGIYLICVNLFQIGQYNKMILHYDHMNRKYYSRIYLNNNPSPLDMSLLDTDEWIDDEKEYDVADLIEIDSSYAIHIKPDSVQMILDTTISSPSYYQYLKAELEITINCGLWDTWLYSELQGADSLKINKIRLFNPLSKEGKNNKYEFYIRIPDSIKNQRLKLYIHPSQNFKGVIKKLKISGFRN